MAIQPQVSREPGLPFLYLIVGTRMCHVRWDAKLW